MIRPRTFWLSAMATAIAIAMCFTWLFPYGALGLDSEPDRTRVWLLTLWTSGVLAICFGLAGWTTAFSAVGFRDVAEHGSVPAAVEAKKEIASSASESFYNFAGWATVTGVMLIGIYFLAWFNVGS